MTYLKIFMPMFVGFVLCAIGVYLLRQAVRMRRHWKSAEGRVVKHLRSSDEPDCVHVRVSFNSESGRRHTCRSFWSSNHPPEVGTIVQVRYPENDPDEAEILSGRSWTAPVLFLGCGVIASAVGVLALCRQMMGE